MRTLVFFLSSFAFQELCSGLRLTDVRVPTHVAQGSDAVLECHYHLEEEILYSVRWYKDGSEFYHYVPRNDPPTQFYPRPGVQVDLSRSSSTRVWLLGATAATAGTYGCEVSGEAPLFQTVSHFNTLDVLLLPDEGPRIGGGHRQYQVGETANLNCTSAPSRPAAHLTWLVNGRPAPPKYLHGPWVHRQKNHTDALITRLQLRFKVTSEHFRYGDMQLKCVATISPMYQREAGQRLEEPQAESALESRAVSIAPAEPGGSATRLEIATLAILYSFGSVIILIA